MTGYIFISGREKDVIVLKNGKNIFPEEIEIEINRIEGVKECMIFGKPDTSESDVKIAAKIVYDKDVILELYNETEITKIKEIIWEKVKLVNKTMPVYKYVREIIVTDEELIKTTTQKVKRHEEMKKI